MKNIRILILDAESNAALSLLQTLGQLGYEICLAGADPDSLGRKSRFCSKFLLYPDPLKSKCQFIEWFSKTIEIEVFDLILPVTDISIYPLMEFSGRQPVQGLILPPRDSFDFFFNKSRTLDLARECGVPYPASQLILPDQGLEGLKIRFPCYIKPIRSKVWTGDKGKELDARLVNSSDELEQVFALMSPFGGVLLQEYVRGVGVGIELFCVNGGVLLSFAHRRVHEYPLTGGGSTYRVSIEMPEALFKHASCMVKKAGWTGVAMVEFKVDGSHAHLMEVNGRFWGSLPLSVRAGANFPKAVVEWELNGEIAPFKPYRIGVFSRKFTMDLAWFSRNLRADRKNPYLMTRPVLKTILEYFRVLTGQEYWDHASLNDPAPVFSELRKTFSNLLTLAFRKIVGLGVRLKMPLVMAREPSRSKSRLQSLKPRKLLFVCHGNICRSPFSEKMLANLLPGNEFEVNSCGFFREPSRKSPEEIRKIARGYGVDLEGHRSKTINDSLCHWADVIVVMDAHNWQQMDRFNRHLLEKTVWLGAWSRENVLEIPDPFGLSSGRMSEILQQISEDCLDFSLELTKVHNVVGLHNGLGELERPKVVSGD
ncbi:MAG: arsenate reductase/protein-tyrosine-phosphatase family protein [Leptospirales bacterium]